MICSNIIVFTLDKIKEELEFPFPNLEVLKYRFHQLNVILGLEMLK